MSRPTVLVTDAETAPAVVVIRSLGRAGWRVVTTSWRSAPAGSWSRYTRHRFRIPSFETDADRAVDRILTITREENVDLVIPVTDKAAVALLGSRHDLGGARLATADDVAVETARDKRQIVELAGQLGVPTPRTEVVHDTDQAVAAAAELGYPVVIKPIRSHERVGDRAIITRSVGYAHDEAELRHRLVAPEHRGFPVLLQERVGGEGVGVELLADQGRPLAAFQHRRLRQVPLTGGMSASRVSETLDPVLLDESVRLLAALQWTGLAMVEYRVDAEGHHLMEINGRIWGSIALPVRAGMDFPRKLAELMTHDGIRPSEVGDGIDQSYEAGVECRNLELELRWLTAAARHRSPTPVPWGEWWRVALGLLDPRHEFDVQMLDDVVPGVIDAFGSATRLSHDSLQRMVPELKVIRR